MSIVVIAPPNVAITIHRPPIEQRLHERADRRRHLGIEFGHGGLVSSDGMAYVVLETRLRVQINSQENGLRTVNLIDATC
jgi:hypothetical protein